MGTTATTGLRPSTTTADSRAGRSFREDRNRPATCNGSNAATGSAATIVPRSATRAVRSNNSAGSSSAATISSRVEMRSLGLKDGRVPKSAAVEAADIRSTRTRATTKSDEKPGSAGRALSFD